MARPDKKENVSPEVPHDARAVGQTLNADSAFVLQDCFPDAESVFRVIDSRPASIISKAMVILDTSTLLAPYNVHKHSLEKIRQVLGQLRKEGRLFVPGHVAREFARQRANHLKDTYQRLSQSIKGQAPSGTIPLLAPLKEYQELQAAQEKLAAQQAEVSKRLAKVLDKVRDWSWDDPVSTLYHDLFDKTVIADLPIDRQEILKELERHQRLEIPPGYKDASKADNAAGDLIIWKTVLDLGAKHKRSALFVTGEEKSDWWHKSDGRTLYPRFELQDAYRRASEGGAFAISPLHEFLDLFGATSGVVEDVKRGEQVSKNLTELVFGLEADRRIRRADREKRLISCLSRRFPAWAFWKQPDDVFDMRAVPVGATTPVVGVDILDIISFAVISSGRIADRYRQAKMAGADRVLILIQSDYVPMIEASISQCLSQVAAKDLYIGTANDTKDGDFGFTFRPDAPFLLP